MTGSQGLLDTNVLILRAGIDPAELPEQMAIANRLPLYTVSPKDFGGLEHLLNVETVLHPGDR